MRGRIKTITTAAVKIRENILFSFGGLRILIVSYDWCEKLTKSKIKSTGPWSRYGNFEYEYLEKNDFKLKSVKLESLKHPPMSLLMNQTIPVEKATNSFWSIHVVLRKSIYRCNVSKRTDTQTVLKFNEKKI